MCPETIWEHETMGKIALASINIDFCLWNSLPQDPVETWEKKV